MYCSSSDFFPSLFKHPVFKYVELEWVVSVRCRFSTNIASFMIVVFVKHFLMHYECVWIQSIAIYYWFLHLQTIQSFSQSFLSWLFTHFSNKHSFISFLIIHSSIHSFLKQTLIHSFILSFINMQYTPSILQLRQQNRLQLSGISSKAADSVAQQISSHRILYASHRLSFSTIQHPAERALIQLEVVLVRRAVLRRQRLIRQLALTSLPNPLLPPANRSAPAATWGRSWAYRNQPRPRFPPQNGTKHPSPPS